MSPRVDYVCAKGSGEGWSLTKPCQENVMRKEPNMETITMPSMERSEKLICTDCGATFASHGAGDGLEQLCNECYAAQFNPQRPIMRPVRKASLISPN